MAQWVLTQEECFESFSIEQLLVSPLGGGGDPCNQSKPVAGPDEIRAACGRVVAGVPEGAFREAMRSDAEALVGTLLRLCPDSLWLTLQVEIVGKNACTRWHQDQYVCRAIITYVGPGTWLVDDESVRYDQFKATRGAPSEVSDRCIVPSFDSIIRPSANTVVLMKGSVWPGIRGVAGYEGLTHRAPDVPADAYGNPVLKRICLKIDLAMRQPNL